MMEKLDLCADILDAQSIISPSEFRDCWLFLNEALQAGYLELAAIVDCYYCNCVGFCNSGEFIQSFNYVAARICHVKFHKTH